MAGLINIGVQALNANQRALDVTGQNIANVNSPGYSRQLVQFDSRAAPELGVNVENISRAADRFATGQLWTDTASASASDAFVFFANQLDNSLASSNTSVSAAMDVFFSALQTGIDDPTSIPSREVVLAESEALVRRFNDQDDFFESQNAAVTTRVSDLLSQVSQYSEQIAGLNDKIEFATVRDEPANELKDKRDELVRQLSEIVGITTHSASDSDSINIFIGNGQPLVVGNIASAMRVQSGDPDPDDLRVMVDVGSQLIEVGDEVTGGEVGGLLSYREQMLLPAWNELGRLAVVFADTMNTQHQQGMDLDGELGQAMFADLSRAGEVRPFAGNLSSLASSPSLLITDSSKLQASDYLVNFNQADQLVIVRESDGRRFTLADFSLDNSDPLNQADMTYFADPAAGSLRINLDGMTLELDTVNGFTKGDQFLVKPVSTGAEKLDLNLSNGRQLAFASPVRGSVASDNSGGARISAIEISEPGNAAFTTVPGQLTPPLEIVFNSGTPTTFDVLDVSDPDDPQPYLLTSTSPATAMTGITYSSGQPIQLNGFAVTIEQQPDAGDRFSFDYNSGGISDNTNALRMSDLQQAKLVDGAAYQDNYGLLVERVGTDTSVAQLNAQADATVLKNAQAVRDGISGVNLDEEAANIVKFQQAYQAAAQLISTSRTLFDTLLSVSGG